MLIKGIAKTEIRTVNRSPNPSSNLVKELHDKQKQLI